MSQFELPIRYKNTNPGHVDWYYGPVEGYVDVAAACLAAPFVIRYWGMTVLIQSTLDGQPTVVEYWWRRGLSNAELEQKTGSGATTPNEYNLPVASAEVLGGSKVSPGSGLQIDPATGQLSLENQGAAVGTVDITPNVTLNSLKAGTRYQVSLQEFATLATTLYYEPAFGAFTFRGISSTTGETGTAYPAGSSAFAWGLSNPGNLQPGSLKITDVTAAAVLAQNLVNDGYEELPTPAFSLVLGESHRFRIEGLDTNNAAFSSEVVLNGARAIFWGSAAARPASSANVRALSGYQLTNQGNTLILNTGTTNRIFALWLPAGLSLQLVLDLETNATLTSLYNASPLSVNDAGGAAVAGTLYVMEQAIPYSGNHRHQLTIG